MTKKVCPRCRKTSCVDHEKCESLWQALQILKAKGLVVETETGWALTEEGKKADPEGLN